MPAWPHLEWFSLYFYYPVVEEEALAAPEEAEVVEEAAEAVVEEAPMKFKFSVSNPRA